MGELQPVLNWSRCTSWHCRREPSPLSTSSWCSKHTRPCHKQTPSVCIFISSLFLTCYLKSFSLISTQIPESFTPSIVHLLLTKEGFTMKHILSPLLEGMKDESLVFKPVGNVGFCTAPSTEAEVKSDHIRKWHRSNAQHRFMRYVVREASLFCRAA